MPALPLKVKYRRSTDPLLARLKTASRNLRKYGDMSGTLDPYGVYRVRARKLAGDAETGLERFAYGVFGPDLMASLAFAIDPFSEFRFTGAKISPTNRLRRKTTIWKQNRSYLATTDSESCTNGPDLSTPNQFDRTPVNCSKTRIFTSLASMPAQQGYNATVSDTTSRTRPLDSGYGEFELFVPNFRAPSRLTSIVDYIESYVMSGGYLQVSNSRKTYDFRGQGPGVIIDPTAVEAVKGAEQASALAYIGKYGFGMFKDTLPEHPEFDAFYNLAELKDLPQMLRSTVRLFKDVQGSLSTLEGVGDQYLNFKFGWESTYNAVKDLLFTPTRIAKRINYLLTRRGKATTYRTKKKFLDGVPSVPSVPLQLMASWESLRSSGVTSSREIELRLMLNATLEFPQVTVPEVRADLLVTLLGTTPTPSDLYNLVPWTWLADWFSGLGDYLQLMDSINRDPSLINYGFISYVSHGKCTYSYETQQTGTHQIIYPPQPTWIQNTTFYYPYSAEFTYRYHLRKDVTSIGGVKSVSKPSSLSVTQLAIIGALLTKWFHN